MVIISAEFRGCSHGRGRVAGVKKKQRMTYRKKMGRRHRLVLKARKARG